MIVDDHPAMRQLLHRLCDGLAAEVVECSTGPEAVRCFASQRPDWVVMDVNMPGQDGFSASREILSEFPGARIVVVSEESSPVFRARAREVGAVGFVAKDNLLHLPELLRSHPESLP
jgi:CheY-like chemotaxis protein